ncbi:unnamed protein product [Paramecium octaurelia]|uniref:Uncharacterized protein n=1 Tax=Paramecium octaurelia TaxID=43137 RepID=A0A8S1YCX5_PAROT|nr:unnamed protein product [Paramecium octaurelia]
MSLQKQIIQVSLEVMQRLRIQWQFSIEKKEGFTLDVYLIFPLTFKKENEFSYFSCAERTWCGVGNKWGIIQDVLIEE